MPTSLASYYMLLNISSFSSALHMFAISPWLIRLLQSSKNESFYTAAAFMWYSVVMKATRWHLSPARIRASLIDYLKSLRVIRFFDCTVLNWQWEMKQERRVRVCLPEPLTPTSRVCDIVVLKHLQIFKSCSMQWSKSTIERDCIGKFTLYSSTESCRHSTSFS